MTVQNTCKTSCCSVKAPATKILGNILGNVARKEQRQLPITNIPPTISNRLYTSIIHPASNIYIYIYIIYIYIYIYTYTHTLPIHPYLSFICTHYIAIHSWLVQCCKLQFSTAGLPNCYYIWFYTLHLVEANLYYTSEKSSNNLIYIQLCCGGYLHRQWGKLIEK